MNIKGMPLWQKNFQLYVKSYPIISLSGCIEDQVPDRNALGKCVAYLGIDQWIFENCSTDQSHVVVFYSAISGFGNPFSEDHLKEFKKLGGGTPGGFPDAVQKIRAAADAAGEKKLIVIFDSSIRWITAGPFIQADDQKAFTILKSAVSRAPGNLQLIFLNEKISDLPAFLIDTASLAKAIVIPRPDQVQRTNFLEYLFSNRSFTRAQLELPAQRAENLTLKEIRTALKTVDYGKCTPGDLVNRISLFQFGFSEDPWQQLNANKIDHAKEFLQKYVFGQDRAVSYAAEIVKYAASGFGSIFQEDGRTAPKGVLFLSGPSGTGKTELAKALARLVFGSADAMLRFDMGEYNQPHSAERLTGAPPGYIGHEAGGQLTKAIKAHPFSLLLFDEIEKAHPSVMNKFLSILEDGRLTDGKGETVSFENTIIVFTSNLGAADAAGERDPERVREIISSAVKDYCEANPPVGIGKPELYSRLAGNIIVFDPLSNEAIEHIFDNYYDQAVRKISEQMGITLQAGDTFKEKLRRFADEGRENGEFPGGRGMKKAMDKYFLVPLSSFLQCNHCTKGDTVVLNDFEISGDISSLQGNVIRGTDSGDTGGTIQRPQQIPATEERRHKGFKSTKKI